jgi:hypothetical protein
MKTFPGAQGGRWLGTAVAACFALGAFLGWRQIASPDIGFHLSTARWMVENRAWPATDLFSYTFSNHAYIDLQWLFQLVLYGANALTGPAGMIALKILVTLTFWALLVVRTRRAAGSLPASVPLLLIVVGLADFWEERPHTFSWVWGSLILLVLEEHARGSRRWLPALPLLTLVWVNSHQMFVLGPVMIAVYALWELRKGRGADRAFIGWSVAAAAACLVNPYGLHGALLPATLFGEIQEGHVFTDPEAGFFELQGPYSLSLYFLAGRFVLFQAPLYWHLYTLAVAVGVAGAWRRLRAPELVLGALFTWTFALAQKNFGYFVMVTFPIAAIGIDRVIVILRDAWRERRKVAALLGARPTTPVWIALGLVALLMPLLVTGRLHRLAWSDFPMRTGFNSRFLPVEAGEFINAQKLSGRVVTSLGFGSYVHWATRQSVNIYGIQEVFGPAFYREYLDSLTHDGFLRFLARWHPTIAVVSFAEAPVWTFALSGQPGWRLAHYTDTSAVFLHESVPGPAALGELRPGIELPSRSRADLRRQIADAGDLPDMTWGAWWRGNEPFRQREVRLATFYLHMGWLGAAISTAADGLAATPLRNPDLLMVMGNAFNALGDYDLADLAYAGALRSPYAGDHSRRQVDAAKAARGRKRSEP